MTSDGITLEMVEKAIAAHQSALGTDVDKMRAALRAVMRKSVRKQETTE